MRPAGSTTSRIPFARCSWVRPGPPSPPPPTPFAWLLAPRPPSPPSELEQASEAAPAARGRDLRTTSMRSPTSAWTRERRRVYRRLRVTACLRQIVLLSLLVLHAISGVGAARAFFVCVCSDGGIVLESHAGACGCCAIETSPPVEHGSAAGTRDEAGCCQREEGPSTREHDPCSRFTVVSEDALTTKSAPEQLASITIFAAVPRWFAAPIRVPTVGPGPVDLDPDPHDRLASLRTVVLRH